MEAPIPIVSVPNTNTLDTTKRSIQTTGPCSWIRFSKVCKAFTGVPTDTLQRRGRNFEFLLVSAGYLVLINSSHPQTSLLQGLS